ncbi:hypothetical protein [Cyanobium sp. Copco_Reservoir_LC18]|uniref:hypothetical protein n=1 Tax=Cyanobium sp. Copco_Reservoir_LC18 TaxID=1328305 RepID=UPI0013571384|nr:hypothetical protein [Cyanobium sp. Copco_Reservoir_LC18]
MELLDGQWTMGDSLTFWLFKKLEKSVWPVASKANLKKGDTHAFCHHRLQDGLPLLPLAILHDVISHHQGRLIRLDSLSRVDKEWSIAPQNFNPKFIDVDRLMLSSSIHFENVFPAWQLLKMVFWAKLISTISLQRCRKHTISKGRKDQRSAARGVYCLIVSLLHHEYNGRASKGPSKNGSARLFLASQNYNSSVLPQGGQSYRPSNGVTYSLLTAT